jgi:hypothetical protein
MKPTQPLLLSFVFALLAFPGTAKAQLWSGVISSTRAVDWSQAGLPAGLPDKDWTQCGETIAAYSGTAEAISNQIQSCGAGQFVLLGPGTFNLSSSIDFGSKAHVVLRGSGANKTSLVFSGASSVNCNIGASTLIAICSTDQTDFWSDPPVYQWTAGYGQGSNQITLSSTAEIVPGTMIFLSQDDDGYTGYPATGSSIDNGGYFVCADEYETNPTTGCSYNGPDGTYPSPFTHRWQYEAVVATAVKGNVVTISPSLKHPNWRTSQVPTAMLIQPLESSGVEDLSIDESNNQDTGYAIDIWACDGCWVSGVEVKDYYNWGIGEEWSVHGQFQDNYIYDGAGTGPDSYGIRLSNTADNLIVNNIFQHIRSSVLFDGPDVGSVVAYNYSVNQFDGSDAMFLAFWPHSAGDDFELFEGNVSDGVVMDSSHGGHLNQTMLRNLDTGWESCANGNCGTSTTKDWGATAAAWPYDMRYGNMIGNVLGTPGFHALYDTSAFGGCASGQCAVYNLGAINSAVTPPVPSDPLAASTMLRWANWDTVTSTAHFCGDSSDTDWSSTCAGKSEVPTGAPSYPNSVPTKGDTKAGQGNLPASFYYSSKPSWFGAVPWPAIGPDVSGGNVGMCSGELNTPGQYAGLPATSDSQCTGTTLSPAWGGHVNAIPAMACFFSLGGVPDGTGGELSFDASDCYTSSSDTAVDGGTGRVDGGSVVRDAGSREPTPDAGGRVGEGGGPGNATGSGSSNGGGCLIAGGVGQRSEASWVMGLACLIALGWRRRCLLCLVAPFAPRGPFGSVLPPPRSIMLRAAPYKAKEKGSE